MKITKVSLATGVEHTMELNVTQEQLDEFHSGSKRHIQEIFSHLEPHEREFLLTGITKEEWDAMFPEEEE